MEKVMESLKDHHYDGSLTLEIEDLNLDRLLTAEEKVALACTGLRFYAGMHGISAGFI